MNLLASAYSSHKDIVAHASVVKESKTGDFVVTLDKPIQSPKWIILHSATVHLVRVLEDAGEILSEGELLLSIPPGEYTLDAVKKAIDTAVHVGGQPAQIVSSGSSQSSGSSLILRPGRTANKALRQLLAIPESADGLRLPISWSQPQIAWIHCDLVDANSVFVSKKQTTARRADILGGIAMPRGNQLTYSTLSPARIKARPVSQVHTLHFRVVDENGALIVLHNNSLHIIFTETAGQDYRLKKIADVQTAIETELGHYEQVLKKYVKSIERGDGMKKKCEECDVFDPIEFQDFSS
ncbi:hypothetical protein QZH41_001433 [Actinostola sp. cb2023]|nr:hypothetical protein QZH41_001433 [Actinostola sp. cb2023]